MKTIYCSDVLVRYVDAARRARRLSFLLVRCDMTNPRVADKYRRAVELEATFSAIVVCLVDAHLGS